MCNDPAGVRLLNPQRLFSREEVLRSPCPVPASPGVYAWFFRNVPEVVPTSGCVEYDGLRLLYVGISPRVATSTQTLRHRVRYHYRGNAEGSTLRRTLGILLTPESGFPLRRVGTNGRRMTFTNVGERWLDGWLLENAFVTWVVQDEPWVLEEELMRTVSLPLNLQGNRHHPFSTSLSNLRRGANAHAHELPIVNDQDPR